MSNKKNQENVVSEFQKNLDSVFREVHLPQIKKDANSAICFVFLKRETEFFTKAVGNKQDFYRRLYFMLPSARDEKKSSKPENSGSVEFSKFKKSLEKMNQKMPSVSTQTILDFLDSSDWGQRSKKEKFVPADILSELDEIIGDI